MKVFEISHTPKPTIGRFRSYAGLCLKEEDTHILMEVGKGRPYQGSWKAISLYIPNPALPRPDIYGFPGGFVIPDRVRSILGEPLEMCTELLPVAIEGENGPFYVCHIIITMNAVDREMSQWTSLPGKRTKPMLTRPSFVSERLGEHSLFKIPDDGYTVNYCLERTCDPEDGEFKALVEQNAFTGLHFTEVWSSQ